MKNKIKIILLQKNITIGNWIHEPSCLNIRNFLKQNKQNKKHKWISFLFSRFLKRLIFSNTFLVNTFFPFFLFLLQFSFDIKVAFFPEELKLEKNRLKTNIILGDLFSKLAPPLLRMKTSIWNWTILLLNSIWGEICCPINLEINF